MQRKVTLGLFVFLFLGLSWACAPLLPYPTGEGLLRVRVDQPQISIKDLEIGRRLYAATCASCHVLHLPSDHTSRDWRKILSRMQVKANIDDDKRDSIFAYLAAMGMKNRD
jgi:mono/diheme cytochrome c family protein